MLEIQDNISDLTIELSEKSKIVLQLKNELDDINNEF